MTFFRGAQIFKNLDVHLQEIIHGTSVAFVFRCLGAVLALSSQVVLVRVLGVEDAGRYILSVSCVQFISVLGQMGLGSILVRFIASHSAARGDAHFSSIQRAAMQIALPASLFLMLVLYLSSGLISSLIFKDPNIQSTLQIMAFAVPLWTAATLHSEMLRGLKKIGAYLFIQSIVMPSVILIGFLVFQEKFGLTAQAFVYVLAALVTAFIAIYLWRRSLREVSSVRGAEVSYADLLKSSLPMLGVACIFYINTWISTMILGGQGNPADVALYNSANRLALAPGFLLISVSSILGPKLSAIHKIGTRLELQRVVSQATMILFFLTLPVFSCFFAFPRFFLDIFGPEFGSQSVALVLQVLVVGQVLVFVTGFAGQLLIMTGHEKDLRDIMCIAMLLNLIAAYFLILHHGIVGAAWASTLSTLFISVATVVFVKKRLKISTHVFTKIKEMNNQHNNQRN